RDAPIENRERPGRVAVEPADRSDHQHQTHGQDSPIHDVASHASLTSYLTFASFGRTSMYFGNAIPSTVGSGFLVTPSMSGPFLTISVSRMRSFSGSVSTLWNFLFLSSQTPADRAYAPQLLTPATMR